MHHWTHMAFLVADRLHTYRISGGDRNRVLWKSPWMGRKLCRSRIRRIPFRQSHICLCQNIRLSYTPCVYRKIDVFQRVTNQPNSRPRRIIAAILRFGVKGRTDDLTCSATITFINIDFDDLDFLLNLTHFLISSLFEVFGNVIPNLIHARTLS